MNLPMDPRTETLTAMDQFTSAYLWARALGVMVPLVSVMTASYLVVPSHRSEWLSRLLCRSILWAVQCRWRAVVHPDIRMDQQYLFASNHVNALDFITMYQSTPHFKQGVELQSHFKIPFYGWFMKGRGTIGVRPGKSGQTPEIMDHFRREIEEGRSILGFPEGHRTLDGRVLPFRKGLFYIARDLGVPIAPTAVVGMYRVKRKGSWVFRPNEPVTVYIEAPVETKGLTYSQVPELAAHVQSVVAKRVDAYWEGRDG